MDFAGIISGMQPQTIVWWAVSATLDGAGNQTYSAAVEISGRWEDMIETFITTRGEEKTSKALVWPDVTKSIAVGDYLYLGELTDLDSTQLSAPNYMPGAYRIERLDDIKDLDGATTLKKAYL